MGSGWKVRGFVLDELLGRGGSSEVWRAHVAASGEAVALKRLVVPGAEQVRRAHAEAAKLIVLDHPHLVRLHALLPDDDAAVLVLDLADGGSLADLLLARGRLTPGEVITAVAPVAAALAYLHGAGVVHGDVSAANILFTSRGSALLADLGVARLRGETVEVESTPAYIDPMVAGGGLPTPFSDVFMLGAVSLHALTGAPLWPGASADEVLDAARRGEPGDLAARLAGAGVDEAMAAVVRRALHADARYRGTAADLALDLRHCGTPLAVELAAGRERPDPPPGEPVPPAPTETRPRAARHAAVTPSAPTRASRRAERGPSAAAQRVARRTGAVAGPRRRSDAMTAGDAGGGAAAAVAPDRPDPSRGAPADRSRAAAVAAVPTDPSRPAFERPRAAAPEARGAEIGPRRTPPTAAVAVARPALPPAPARWRRPSTVLITLALVALAVAAALKVWSPGSGGADAAGPNRTARLAASPARVSPDLAASAATDGSTTWRMRLESLDAVRARAYSVRDPSLLRQVYASATLLAADTTQLSQLVPPGCGLAGVRTTYAGVRASPVAAGVQVTATARLAAATLRCRGAPRGRTQLVAPARLAVLLVPYGRSWRIADLRRVS